MLLLVSLPITARAYDLNFEYTSFEATFGQAQFDVLNYASKNGNYMMTSTDNHRPEMVANGNALAEFYNNFNADYNHPTAERRTPAEEAAHINAYTLNNSTNNGPRPDWLILNEISPSQWQLNPGAPSLSEHRTWVIDTVTLLHDQYGYNVITYSPYQQLGTTANAPSWQALAAKSYIAIEAYLSGPEVMAGGSDYASRVAYAKGRYEAAKNSYLNVGIPHSKIFISEHFANNGTHLENGTPINWGRAGMASAADWDQVIMARQDAILTAKDKNNVVGFTGFLAYNWGGNGMGVTQAEQIQHEYYYRSRLTLPTQQPQWLSDSAINVNGTVIPLSWNQPLNWKGGVPNASGAIVNFWRTLTANRTITLDGAKTVGTILFDSPFSYTITPGTGGSILLNNSGNTATITSNQGNHTIGPSVRLDSDLNAIINSGTLTIGTAVFGLGKLTKSGPGILALNGLNSYAGDTIVAGGTLRIASRNSANVADVYLVSGATLDLTYTGLADTIDSLFINGISQPAGIWGAPGNMSATFHSPLITGTGMLQVSTYLPPPYLIGDYNDDGIVDAADYAVWRKSVGQASIPNRDPINMGAIGQADFNSWRAHFGESAGSGSDSQTTVPEPAALALLALSTAALSDRRSRIRRG
jgi:autotransporter-associated beta strand protein